MMKGQIIAYFRVLEDGSLFEGMALIWEGRLFENLVSRVGFYLKGAFIRGGV